MNSIKKQLCLVFVCSSLIINQTVAMDESSSSSSSFSPKHTRSHSASKAEIISLDSPSSSRLVRVSPKKKDSLEQPFLIMVQEPTRSKVLGEAEQEFLAAKTRATDTSTRLLGEQMQFAREKAAREQEIVDESLALKKEQFAREQELVNKNLALKEEQFQRDSNLIAAQIGQFNANTQSILASIQRENANSTWSEALTSPAFWKPVITGIAAAVAEVTLQGIIKIATTDKELAAIERQILLLDRTNKKMDLEIRQTATTSLANTIKNAKEKIDELTSKINNGEELSASEDKTLKQYLTVMRQLAAST